MAQPMVVLEHGLLGETMTEEEFVAWCDEDIRAEFVDGRIILMPSAELDHEEGVGFLDKLMGLFVESHDLGKVIPSNYQVRLARGRRRLPDLSFVSRENFHKLEKSHCEGAPDLIVEIVSAESRERDWDEKYLQYESCGVKEYWVIDADRRKVEIFVLGEDGRYRSTPLKAGKLRSTVLPGFWVRPSWFWQSPRPGVLTLAREMKIL